MATPTLPPVSRSRSEVEDPRETRVLPWVASGVEAGLLGAAVVALFFLGVDLLAGRPLWTPHALGSALFLARLPEPGAVSPVLVLAYTAIHGTVFIGFGVPAAFQVLTRAPASTSGGALALLGLLLFVGFEAVFLAMAQLFVPGLLGLLGFGRVALANAAAAACMALFLRRRALRAPPAG
jgi:hypothetical protein